MNPLVGPHGVGGETVSPRRSTALALGAVLLAVTACAPAPRPTPAEEGPPAVVVRQEPTTAASEERARALYDQAAEAYRLGRLPAAIEAASTVVEDFPGTRVSGEALWLLAQAREQNGDLEPAAAAAGRYADLLPPGDGREGDARLLQGRAFAGLGRNDDALDRLLRIPPEAPSGTKDEALAVVRAVAASMDRTALGDRLAGTPLGQPLAAPLMLAYARALRLGGEAEGAREYAEAALAAGATGADAEGARALLSDLEGDRDPAGEAGPPVVIGALLSASGPPTLQRYSSLIEEGVRAAVESSDAPPNVSLVVDDDEGDPARAAQLVGDLEAEGVVGVIGPLLDDMLSAAAAARSGPMPLVSPTALTAAGDAGVFSFGAPDPGAAQTLARYAAGSGLRYVVVIHPDEPEAAFQAAAFQEALQELRGSVLRTLTYAPGTTHFEALLRQAEALRPDALFLPVPEEDVVALAPQVSFFGLDTLGVNVLGTGAWASPEVLRNVSPRHTNGVVTAAPRTPETDSEPYLRFVRAYEERFQRSLRDPLPATGYDAASLILLAVRTGARTADQVRSSLESIRDYQGATGVLSVMDGRVVHEQHLVCIQEGRLLDVEPGQASIHFRPTRAGDPEAKEPEVVPTGPLEIYCPGAAPEELPEGIVR